MMGRWHGKLLWKAHKLSATKSSTLIGQLAKVHICDWLTKVKQIYAVLSADLWQLGP